MKKNSTQILLGFARQPEGSLLDQVILQTEDFAFAYERSIHFYKGFHIHDRPMFVFPRGSSKMEIRLYQKNSERVLKLTVDSSQVAFVPQCIEHDDEATELIYDTFAFFPSYAYLDNMMQVMGVDVEQRRNCLHKPAVYLRTSAMNECCNYILSKALSKADMECAQKNCFPFLSSLLADAMLATDEPSTKLQKIQPPSEVTKALGFIESNLFSDFDNADLAKHVAISERALARKFKEHTGLSMNLYVRIRRLDEAKVLLKRECIP